MKTTIKNFLLGLLLALGTAHSFAQAQEREPYDVTVKICQWEARTAEHVRANKLVGIRKMDLQARMGLDIQQMNTTEQIRKEMQGQVLEIIDQVYNTDWVTDLPASELLALFYTNCVQGR